MFRCLDNDNSYFFSFFWLPPFIQIMEQKSSRDFIQTIQKKSTSVVGQLDLCSSLFGHLWSYQFHIFSFSQQPESVFRLRASHDQERFWKWNCVLTVFAHRNFPASWSLSKLFMQGVHGCILFYQCKQLGDPTSKFWHNSTHLKERSPSHPFSLLPPSPTLCTLHPFSIGKGLKWDWGYLVSNKKPCYPYQGEKLLGW